MTINVTSEKYNNYVSRLQLDTRPPELHPAIMDTGATGHFLLCTAPCVNVRPASTPIQCQLPTGMHMVSTHEAELNIPNCTLPKEAIIAHIFPDLAAHSLISIGNFCDHGCEAVFTATDASIVKDGQTILKGYRNPNGLWILDLQQPTKRTQLPQLPEPAVHISAMASSTTGELMQFLHAACFSPVPSTLIKAIHNGHFATWPGFTADNVRKHLPKSIATTKGHLDQTHKNQRSTKTGTKLEEPDDSNDITASPPNTDGRPTHLVYAAVLTAPSRTGQIYTDQTGRFPVQSRRGNKYIMVLYDYDSNGILAEPLKNRTDSEMIRGYQALHDELVARGLKPQLQKLDNEASKRLKQFIKDQDMDFQLVPAHMHRRNAAKRAIRTFKNHFIAGLCSTDKLFPMNLWDRLLPQALITLNLLRASRLNPRLSAYAQLHGSFDFNATPLAPPGTRVVVHEKPSVRASWAPHGQEGWYVGPAMEHYRCYIVHVSSTNAERIGDTVEFFPQHSTMPKLSSADAAMQAAQDLIRALEQPHPATPFDIGDEQILALRQLADIFASATAPSKRCPEPPRVEVTSTPTEPLLHPYNTRSKDSSANPSANSISHQRTADILEQPRTINNTYNPFANAVIDPNTGEAMEYRQLITQPATRATWLHSAANEFGRLAQGVGNRIKGTDTIKFIPISAIPRGRTVTYARFVCELRPQKAEVERTRLTVGGNLVDYPGDVSTSTADLTTSKILWNSVLSTPNAKYMCADVKNFYLNTPMDRPEYMRIPITLIPQEIIDEYHLHAIEHNGFVYVEINKGMYGLPQAGILANKLLAKRLATKGYFQATHTPGLWTHSFRPIQFTLVVDDFGIKYVGTEHANHLISALQDSYEVSTDWKGELYCGITLKWDYETRTLDTSMPNYIKATLTKFQHPKPIRPQYAPHRCNPPQFGVKVQLTELPDDSPLLPPPQVRRCQQIVGVLLYYARAVDNTLLVPLSAIASEQSKATENTAKAIRQLLDYCATNPNAITRYKASDMQLRIHSDAGYLNEPQACSRVGGHFYLSNKAPKDDISNGAILNPTGVLKVVVSSAAEAEVAGLFVNGKEGTVIRTTLAEMGHQQEATPIQTDNSTASGIANETIKQQRSRAMDMRFYWVRDRVKQGQFRVYWAPAETNLADYFTKHHPPSHHK